MKLLSTKLLAAWKIYQKESDTSEYAISSIGVLGIRFLQ